MLDEQLAGDLGKSAAASVIGKTKSKYRPDIDGLRAVAVLGVILFHLQLLKGGFVGVDVFFVISGFLITSVLIKDLVGSTYSLKSFYERRIRRIAPALVAMLAVTWIAGYRYLLPSDFKDYARWFSATLLSLSNIFFWKESGYFDAPSLSKPLLHTWSLAVEEQFYLLFPLILAGLFRLFPRRIVISLAVSLGASLSLCILVTSRSPDSAFYWPLTRAWELLIGSLLALTRFPSLHRGLWRNLVAVLGLCALLAAMTRFSSLTPFPSYTALLPCLGAAMIIGAGSYGKTLVGRLLSLKPLVFTGLISYSLYLWHWPLIVFTQHGLPLTFGLSDRGVKSVLLAATFLIATLSWLFVERPLRRARHSFSPGKVFAAAGIIGAVLSVLAMATLKTNGFRFRFGERAQRIAAYQELTASLDRQNSRMGACFLTSGNRLTDFSKATCLAMDASRENVLLTGDSYAAMLYHGLRKVFPQINFLQANASGCLPVVESGQKPGTRDVCRLLMRFVLTDFLPAHQVSKVLIAGHWQNTADVEALHDTVNYLQSIGYQPILFGPIPRYDMTLPNLLALSVQFDDPKLPARHRSDADRKLDEEMKIAAGLWRVRYISYYETFCSRRDCMTALPGDVPLQDDRAHLSSAGSEYVAQVWSKRHELP